MGNLSHLKFVLVLTLLIGVISDCGKNSDPGDPPAKAPIGNIQIDAYFSQQHRDAIATALNYLDSVISWPVDSEFTRLMKFTFLSGQNFHQWLEARVQYIVDQSFDVNARAYVAQTNYNYENPGDLPLLEKNRGVFEDNQVQILGFNVGTQVYMVGKQKQELLGVHISRVGDVPVTSPRTGIIQIGEGSFANDPDNTLAKIWILGVIFHEARHSDGNRKSAGFSHVVCPSGHKYAGYAACDNNGNGPYALQAKLVKTLEKTCGDCSAGQREFLENLQTDFLSRVIDTGAWDDRPEGHR